MSDVQNGVLKRGQMQTFLGKMTAFQRDGVTLIRGTTPTTINNPQTAAQMYQRLKFLNLINFFRSVKQFNAKGWEAIPAKNSLYNCFLASNLQRAPFGITHAEYQAGMTLIDAYQVTSGSLPTIMVDTASRSAAEGVSDILLGDLTITASTTIGDFASAVVAENGGRFAYGDEIAFLVLAQYIQNGVSRVRTRRTAVTLIEDSTQLLSTIDLLGFGVCEQRLAIHGVAPSGGYCWVHSRRRPDSDSLYVSTQQIIVVGNDLQNFYRTSEKLRRAAEDLGAVFEEDVFLQCASVDQREALDAFGISYSISKDESDGQGVNPVISYLRYAGDIHIAESAAPTIDTSAAPSISVTLSDIHLLDADSLVVRVNGVECTDAAIELNAVTAKLPTSENGKPLISVSIVSDSAQASATFHN